MSRIVRYMCDGCGKEIERDPVRVQAVQVDAETGEFSAAHWENKNDYCSYCVQQIIHFVERLPAENAGKVGMPDTEFETAVNEMRASLEVSHLPKKNRPTTAELLKGGKTIEEVMQITGCTKASAQTIRSRLRKEGTLPSDQRVTKAVRCSEVGDTCVYAGRTDGRKSCDYLVKAGSRRGCPPEECTRYEKKK